MGIKPEVTTGLKTMLRKYLKLERKYTGVTIVGNIKM
jgi:hypothetical protein